MHHFPRLLALATIYIIAASGGRVSVEALSLRLKGPLICEPARAKLSPRLHCPATSADSSSASCPLVRARALRRSPQGSGDCDSAPSDDKIHFRLSPAAASRPHSSTADALDGWLRVKCSPLVPINQSVSSLHGWIIFSSSCQ